MQLNQALHRAQMAAAGNVGAKNGHPLLQNPLRNRPAHLDRTLVARITVPGEGVVEFPSIRSVQQDGSALRGNHRENQFQYLRLQFIQVANRVHHPADFQQCIQIAREPGSGRKLAENFLRLQVENVFRADLRHRVRRLFIFEFHHARLARGLLFFVGEETKDRIADGNLIEVMQPVVLHRLAIHQRAVPALQIAQLETVTLGINHAVPPRYRRIADRQSVRSVPAQRQFLHRKREHGIPQGSRDRHQPGVQPLLLSVFRVVHWVRRHDFPQSAPAD